MKIPVDPAAEQQVNLPQYRLRRTTSLPGYFTRFARGFNLICGFNRRRASPTELIYNYYYYYSSIKNYYRSALNFTAKTIRFTYLGNYMSRRV